MGPNRPVAPIDDPYQMFQKLYGQVERPREPAERARRCPRRSGDGRRRRLLAEDRRILEEHTDLVRSFEEELSRHHAEVVHAVPTLEEGIVEQNDQMPKISRMQIELIVSSLAADFTRVATLQYMQLVGQPRFKWLGIDEEQHELSHEPNTNEAAQQKLTTINAWYAGEIAHLAKRLAADAGAGEARARSSTIRRSSGRTNSARVTRIRTSTSPGCCSEMAWASRWAGRPTTAARPTIVFRACGWPTRWARTELTQFRQSRLLAATAPSPASRSFAAASCGRVALAGIPRPLPRGIVHASVDRPRRARHRAGERLGRRPAQAACDVAEAVGAAIDFGQADLARPAGPTIARVGEVTAAPEEMRRPAPIS